MQPFFAGLLVMLIFADDLFGHLLAVLLIQTVGKVALELGNGRQVLSRFA